jgi:carbon monoxide dehydrogenase subunit G
MPHLEKSGKIAAPAGEVFMFLADRRNAPELLPELERVWDIEPAEAQLGQTWSWRYRLLGIPIEGTAEMVAFEPDRELRFVTRGIVDSTWTYRVERKDGGCEVAVAVDYELPDTLLAKIGDKMALQRINREQMNELLDNLGKRFG